MNNGGNTQSRSAIAAGAEAVMTQVGQIKQELLKVGWPAGDTAGYVDGEAHDITLEQNDWHLRDYQELAADSFWAGGSGVVVLPCGAGKTMVGAAAMAAWFIGEPLSLSLAFPTASAPPRGGEPRPEAIQPCARDERGKD